MTEGDVFNHPSLSDPDIAHERYIEVSEQLDQRTRRLLTDSPLLHRALLNALALSPFLFQTIMRHPGFIRKLSGTRLNNMPRKESLARQAGHALSHLKRPEDFAQGVRLFRLFHTLRIALRELAGLADVRDTMHEMSRLADVVMEICLRYAKMRLTELYGPPALYRRGRWVRSHISVIDLGKLGGEELNFSSDIDILYVFDSEKGETKPTGKISPLPNAEYYRRLSEQVTRLLSEKTSEGFAFRVDLGLRPDGQFGDIANSLRSMEIYYESWGKLWERAVWIKARHGAGYSPLSHSLISILHPFVYRKYLDFTAIEEIREMKQKIDQRNHLQRKGQDDIKLGKGGIREIEFFAQALQLIYGGKKPQIQCRGTLEALKRIGKVGLIPLQEVETLSQAYLFLRRLEHRIQLVHQRQTQCLPADEEEQERIARSLGFSGRGLSPARILKDQLDAWREKVHKIYKNLFYTPSQHLVSGVSQEIQTILTEDIPSSLVASWLEENGFKFPNKAFETIQRLRQGPPTAHYVPKTLNRLNRLLPSLIQAIIASPDPDMALGYLLSFVEKVGARGTFYALLLENPPVLKLLAKLFGSSHFLSSHLIHHLELLDELINPSQFERIKTREQMERELTALLRETPEDLESEMDSLRKFKHAELLRIGINDIYGDMEITEVTAQLSQVAEVCLKAAYRIASKAQLKRYNLPENLELPFVILGMGKLGGMELNYSSDLDLIFLFNPENHAGLPAYVDPNEFYGKLAQRFITVMSSQTTEGTLYEIDTRLRPSGTFGPIVTSIHSFSEYHRQSAWFWERQALIKANPIAGDPTLFQNIKHLLNMIIYGKPITEKDKKGILEIRAQMEREIAQETPRRKHIKCGYGGLIDIEFLIQYYQLKKGGEFPDVRQPNTLPALETLKKIGALSQNTAHILKENYLFLRKLENRLQILENRSSPFFDPHGPEMQILARRMGYRSKHGNPASKMLLDDYLKITEKNREFFKYHLLRTKPK